MKILITGGLGNVGQAVVAWLQARGHVLRVADRNVAGTENLLPDHVELVVCDITDFNAIRDAVRCMEAVVHLAAIPNPGLAPPAQINHINTTGTYNVFQAAAEEGIQRVVCASSINALGYYYGSVDFPIEYFPIDEDHPTYTTDVYSFSKNLNEAVAEYFWRRDAITSVCLRLPGVFKFNPERKEMVKAFLARAHQSFTTWIALSDAERAVRLAQLLAKWETIRKQRALQSPEAEWADRGYDFQDPDVGLLTGRANFWAYLLADDAAQAFEKALLADIVGAHALFVNAAENSAQMEAETLVKLFFPDVTVRKRKLEGTQALVSIDRARRLIGFEPVHSIRDFLADE